MDLRPLSIGELFDRVFVLYRRHFWLFVGITAVPGVFALAVTLIGNGLQNPALQRLDPDSADFQRALIGMVVSVAALFVVLAVYFVVYMIALGATTLAVSEVYLERSTTIRQVYRRMKGRSGALLLLLFLLGIRLVSGWMLGFAVTGVASVINPVLGGLTLALILLVGGLLSIFVMLRWGVAVPALVLEGRTARQSIKRSIELTRGRLGRVLLLAFCATLVNYAALTLFQAPFWGLALFAGIETWTGFWLNTVGAVLGTIATTVTSPLLIIGLALIYYDARIREEGFDLEVMLAALDGAADPVRV